MWLQAWLADNWFNILSTVGIVASLRFTAISLEEAAKTQRSANLLTVAANHRELWKIPLFYRTLSRVRDARADVSLEPVTQEEWIFVAMVIQHSYSVYYAMQNSLVVRLEGMRRDIGEFFSLPVPRAVWEKAKRFQNEDFAAFVDESIT